MDLQLNQDVLLQAIRVSEWFSQLRQVEITKCTVNGCVRPSSWFWFNRRLNIHIGRVFLKDGPSSDLHDNM